MEDTARREAESEAEWMKRISQGDRASFERFLDAFGPRVHRLARRFAPECEAEDLTQEIFVALFQSAGSFQSRSRLSTWVYRVALNHCLRHREKSQRGLDCEPPPSTSTTAPSTWEHEDHEDHACDPSSDPARHAARRELGQEVRGALGELSDGHRDVVVLHEMHGLTYSECARVLEIPIGTVKSRLFNALRHLRKNLAPYVLGDSAVEATVDSTRPTTTHSAPKVPGETPC